MPPYCVTVYACFSSHKLILVDPSCLRTGVYFFVGKEFIKAISHFGVTPILGHFKEKQIKCKKCKSTWITHEEKQSDVNIAAYLIHHAHLDMFDKALIISADSDLCHAIQLVIDTHKGKEINISSPLMVSQLFFLLD